jgi:putative pyoverdin transport system ATP-binding/permease protein
MFAFLLRQHRQSVFMAIIFGLGSGLITAGLLALVHVILERGPSRALGVAWAFAALCVLMPVCRVLSQILLTRLAQNATLDLRVSLGQQILSTELRRLEQIGFHRLVAVLTEDVSALASGLVSIPGLVLQLAVLAGCLGYLGWLSRSLLVLVIVFIAVGMTSVQVGLRFALQHLRQAREQEDRIFKNLKGLTEGAKELKINEERREAFEKIYKTDAESFHHQAFVGNSIFSVAVTWAHLLFFLLTALLLFVVPRLHLVSSETLNGYMLILLYLLVPLDTLGSLLPGLGKARVSLRNVESLGLSLDNRFPDQIAGERMEWGTLHVSELTHTYMTDREERFTLGPIDLRFEPGTITFITGGNGSGKTTLMKLLVGLYAPEKGGIYLEGELVSDQNRDSYRQNFSVVFSDFFLFDKLLGFAHPDLDAMARDYLVKLHLDHKLTIREGGLSTLDLSQGQRRRLALLTAYLEDRAAYVFDEWAADQDPVFKEVFYRQLLPELRARNKTVIVISHDDRYYDVADAVVKLDEGKVVYDALAESVTATSLAVGSH